MPEVYIALTHMDSLGCASQDFMASSSAGGELLAAESFPKRFTAHWEKETPAIDPRNTSLPRI